MGGMISIILSYIMWKEHQAISEEIIFKKKREAWVERNKILDERLAMELEDKKII